MSAAAASGGRASQRGAALPVVLGLMLVLGVIGSGLLACALAARTEAVRRQQSLQCFWGAESALALVRQRLYGVAEYRDNPSPVELTNGPVAAEATVVRSGQVFTVTARGTNGVARLSRRVRQTFTMQVYDYWDDFALFVGGSGCDLSQSIAIYGDVFCEGSLRMAQAAVVFESLYCLGDLSMSQSAAIYDQAFVGGRIQLGQSSIIYGGSYPFSSPANPYYLVQPTIPRIDWSWYEGLLAQAATQDSGLNFNEDINLSNRVLFVRGDASLKASRRIYSEPPGGVLVVRNSLQLQQYARIESGVTIVCGGVFAMGQNTRIGPNSLVYAGSAIEMKQSGIVATRCSLVTPGTIEMKQAAQATGLLYAGDLLDVSQSAMITGLGFAGRRALLSQGVTMQYSPASLPLALPPGLRTTNAIVITPSEWREL
ncbi:MAG: hypothetical protein N2652_08905 [Kiritimatiellae bacterium]|nr:hypothetical protein [Kiritimatiellia bacterium]